MPPSVPFSLVISCALRITLIASERQGRCMPAIRVHPGALAIVMLALLGMVALSGIVVARDVSPPVAVLGLALVALLAFLGYFAERRVRG